MKLRKAIAYAYPTSIRAGELGVTDAGGWYVEVRATNEAGEWAGPHVAQGNDVFASAADPDLIQLYRETDGEPCPFFLRNGNKLALEAIEKWSK